MPAKERAVRQGSTELENRIEELEKRIDDQQWMIEYLARYLEAHTNFNEYGHNKISEQYRFYLVPYTEDADVVYRAITEAQVKSFRSERKKWIRKLGPRPTQNEAITFVHDLVQHYHVHPERYVDFCVIKENVEKATFRHERRKPATDYLLHVGSIVAFSVKGQVVEHGEQPGMQLRYGLPPVLNNFTRPLTNIIWEVLLSRSDDTRIKVVHDPERGEAYFPFEG